MRSQYQERIVQRKGLVAYRDLPLLHGLQQGGLHLGRSTVDLVGQHEIGKYRTSLNLECLVLLAVDLRTDHIGRQQVRRELNTTEIGLDQVAQRLYGEGLSQARNTLQQDVSVAQQTDQQTLYQVLLTHDHLIHTHRQGIYKRTLALDALLQFANVNSCLHKFYSVLNFLFLLEIYAISVPECLRE